MKRIFLLAMAVLTMASCGNKAGHECCGNGDHQCKDGQCKEGHQCCGQAQDKEIGIQLYSLRELIGSSENYAKNQAEVLKKIADLGYTYVEAANFDGEHFYGVDPKQFKADVEAAGLKVLSSHTGHNLSDKEVATGNFSESLEWWKKAIPAHVAAGMTYVVVPGFDVPDNLKGLKVYCDYFNAVGKLCKEAGLKFGYHNHSHEFNKIEDKVIYDFMLENTDPQYVFFQMDVYWAVNGHVSPVNYFKANPGRFALLHIKDYTEIGQSGMVGFDAIFKNFDVAGAKGYIVEMEGSGVGDILETCRISADYLQKACFVKKSYE